MGESLNILQVIVQNKLRSGGAIQMYLLSRELVARGHRVCALYNAEGRVAEDFDVFPGTGIELRFLPMNRLKLNRRSLETVRALGKLIRAGGYDIIHAHKGNAVDLSWVATLGMDVPIVANRGVDIPLNHLQSMKYRSRKVRRIIAVSEAVKNVVVKTGRVNPAKVDVVYGSVDIERFSPFAGSTLREELGVRPETPVIGFTGNPNPRKGLAFLLEAFAKSVRRSHPGSVLVLLGISPSDLDRHGISETLCSRILPLGFRHDVPNCMAAFDVFVFPGVRDEGLTGTVREAAAMGLPIVTTDVSGNRELIQDGVNGLVVPKGDATSLGKAMVRLLDHPEEARVFGRRARAFVVDNMSCAVRAAKIEHIYHTVIHNHGNRT